MTLSYRDILSGERKRIRARITTKHPAVHYGLPVIVLPDGDALDYGSAILLDYRVEKATPKELALLMQWRQAMPPIEEVRNE